MRDSQGSILLETAISITIFAMAGIAVLFGLSVMHNTGALVEAQSQAENVARNQMEHVFNVPYLEPPATYPSIVAPRGYTVSAVAEEYIVGDPNVAKIVVTASRGGDDVLTLETLRAKP
jgi:type II secretory pathway pseudopilin PulG